jgi:hypothetical protein
MGVHKMNNQVNECGILHAKTDGVTLEGQQMDVCKNQLRTPI